MRDKFHRPGKLSGVQFDNKNASMKGKSESADALEAAKRKDDDLVIEGNTVYEIDRDCFERTKKQKKR